MQPRRIFAWHGIFTFSASVLCCVWCHKSVKGSNLSWAWPPLWLPLTTREAETETTALFLNREEEGGEGAADFALGVPTYGAVGNRMFGGGVCTFHVHTTREGSH